MTDEPPIRATPVLKLAGEPDEMECPNCRGIIDLLSLESVLFHHAAECIKDGCPAPPSKNA